MGHVCTIPGRHDAAAQTLAGLGIEQQHFRRIELQGQALATCGATSGARRQQTLVSLRLTNTRVSGPVGSVTWTSARMLGRPLPSPFASDLLRAQAEDHFAVFEAGVLHAQRQFAARLAAVEQRQQMTVLALQAQGMKFIGGEPMKLATNRLAGSL
jgi:hypothetical protein